MTINYATAETFVGFWPLPEVMGEVQAFQLDSADIPDQSTRDHLCETLYSFDGAGWKVRICRDYLVLMHLESEEPALRAERIANSTADMSTLSTAATSAAWKKYLEALRAWNFVLFAACHTSRNHYAMHDCGEVRLWDCARLLYSPAGGKLRHAHYGRGTSPYLSRFGLRKYDRIPTFSPMTDGVFSDAAFFWETVFREDLVSLAALGSKLVAEHRVANYRACVALAWFELEAWATDWIRDLGYPLKKKPTSKWNRGIADLLKDPQPGTQLANMYSDLDRLREARNRVAHANAVATVAESALALDLFAQMFAFRSGLTLKIETQSPPILGL